MAFPWKKVLGVLTDILNVGRKWKFWKKKTDPTDRYK